MPRRAADHRADSVKKIVRYLTGDFLLHFFMVFFYVIFSPFLIFQALKEWSNSDVASD
jgi:hypothetical protein